MFLGAGSQLRPGFCLEEWFFVGGMGESQVGDVCLGYLGVGSGHPITPKPQGPKEFGSMLEAKLSG